MEPERDTETTTARDRHRETHGDPRSERSKEDKIERK